jgi:hypothetical protein
MNRAFTVAVLFLGLLAHALGCGGSGETDGTGGAPASTSSSRASTGSTSSSSSSSSSSGGSGGAGPCMPVDDSNPCTDDGCDNGLPVHKPTAAGTALATQTAGDCKKAACDAT